MPLSLKYICTTLLSLCFGIVSAQEIENSILPDSVAKRTKVKTVKKRVYNAGGTKPVFIVIERYDTSGHITRRTIQEDTVVNKESTSFFYDTKGHLLKANRAIKGGEPFTLKYTYNASGRIKTKQYVYYDSPMTIEKWMYFSDSGRVTSAQCKVYYDGKNFDDFISCTYNKDGNPLVYEGTSMYKEYTYNDKGLCVKMFSTEDVETDRLMLWYYDDKGRCTKKVDCYVDGSTIYQRKLFHYFYNDKGLLDKEWEAYDPKPENVIGENTESLYQYTYY